MGKVFLYNIKTLILCILIIPLSTTAYSQDLTSSYTFQIATGIVNDLNEIRKAKQVITPIKAVLRDTQKTPTDVYNQTYLLLEKSKQLLQVSGGITHEPAPLKKKKTGRKTPADTYELLQEIGKIIKTIKQSVIDDKNQTIEKLSKQAGKTPPDVYQQVTKSIALIDTLL